MPTTLLFKDGVLVDRRLGAQSFERLKEWIGGVAGLK
jgi:thioredoxin-like negative regulator of GroEL